MDLESAFNYRAVFDTTAKINVAFNVIARRKTNRKWLIRLQRDQKLDRAYCDKLTTFALLGEGGQDFIEDNYARHNRRSGEMPGQGGMISADRAANLKAHVAKFQSSQQIQQLSAHSSKSKTRIRHWALANAEHRTANADSKLHV
jgi:hypothetical protein